MVDLLSNSENSDLWFNLEKKNILPEACSLCFSNIFLFPVVRAELVGPSVSNTTTTYVTLKLQSVKSTTVPVKGTKPTWNQDFLL